MIFWEALPASVRHLFIAYFIALHYLLNSTVFCEAVFLHKSIFTTKTSLITVLCNSLDSTASNLLLTEQKLIYDMRFECEF